MNYATGWSFSDENTKIFCPECNSYLNTFTPEPEIKCPSCDYSCPITKFDYQIVHREKRMDVSARQKMREQQMHENQGKGKESILQEVEEPCPKCGEQRVSFYTKQLRSADEGSTVFYNCKKCGHQWNENN